MLEYKINKYMITLFVITFFIVLGINYLTTLDFEVGSGISEKKRQAKNVEYHVLEPEKPKEIPDTEKK